MQRLDFPPVDFEVEDQLKRILASPRFKNAPNPSAFLELTVRRALKGKKTTGNVVAKALFEGKFFQGVSDDVRVTALNLRRTLRRYYESEGITDVVVISYPEPQKDRTIKPAEGEAYTPRFSHNPNHEPYILLRVAYRFLANETYRDFYKALNLLTGILADNPQDLGALLGIVETICRFADRSWTPQFSEWNITGDLLGRISGIETMNQGVSVRPRASNICSNILSKLEKRAEKHWRYWAARAKFLEQTESPGTKAYYETALKLDRFATESFFPYMYFLIGCDRRDEAVALAQRYCNENVEDNFAISEYGRLLCAAGRREIGIGHLQAAIAMNPGNCSALQSLAVLRFMENDIASVALHLRALRTYCDPDTFLWLTDYLQEHEQQFALEGCVANLLLELPNADASAIAKR